MQPFSNIRVIDLTHVIAGPFCTHQFAALGADVIKVEPPDNPDMLRAKTDEYPSGEKGLGAFFTSQNANKRAICVDLKSKQGQESIKKLIATADVLVENYRVGALSKLGLGYDDVVKIKPDIIYCSLTGFGQTGPLSNRTVYDNVIQAYSGLMAANGTQETAPVKIGPPILDYGTGIQAAFAISAALYQRTFTGKGQYIDIAMLDSALMLMSSNITHYDQDDKLLPLSGNSSAFNPGYACYPTRQGLLMIGAYTPEQVKNMWIVLGDSEHAKQFDGMQPPGLVNHLESDSARIRELLLGKTADEWEIAFNENKVPAARVRSLDEALNDEQLKYRNVIETTNNKEDKSRIPLASYKFKTNGPELKRPPPMLGEHTKEVLEELGYSDQEIKDLSSKNIIK